MKCVTLTAIATSLACLTGCASGNLRSAKDYNVPPPPSIPASHIQPLRQLRGGSRPVATAGRGSRRDDPEAGRAGVSVGSTKLRGIGLG